MHVNVSYPLRHMKAFQLNKMAASLITTTLIVSGLAYAATTITSTSQTVVNNDIMSAAWFNDVNSKIVNLVAKVTNIETNSLSNINNQLASMNAKIAALEAGGNGRISNYQIVTNSSGYQNLHYNTDVYCPAGTIVF